MKKQFIIHFKFALILLGSLIFISTSFAAGTLINGKVTVKKGVQVKVKFEPHPSAVPQAGDQVEFSRMLKKLNIKAGAGKGVVVSVENNFAWIKMTQNEPRLDLDAVIHATGEFNLDKLLLENLNKVILNKPDKTEAWNFLSARHNAGNKDATGYLSQLYRTGQGGTPKDLQKSFRMAKNSADADSTIGHIALAAHYERGQGVKQDLAKAMKHIRIAADRGHTTAIYTMAFYYHYAKGVKQDYETAFKWAQKGADKNDTNCLSFVAYYYENGYFVKKDKEKAIYWYKKSYQQEQTNYARTALKRLGAEAQKKNE